MAAACQGNINVEGTLPETMAEGRDASVVVGDQLTIETDDATLVVDRARMMLGELEIEGRTEASEFEAGPEVLELGLDGEATSVAISEVPTGRYQELGFEMRRGAHDDVTESADFGGEDPASIIVDGAFEGESFSFRSEYAAELEFDLGNLRVRDGETATVTVTFDVAAWFFDPDGSIVDPSASGSQSIIDGNIRDSVAAYAEEEDDDDD
jgi:hypothetical protein